MKMKHLNYAQLEYLMRELGYKPLPIKGQARPFKNSEFDALQVLPLASGEDTAPMYHLFTLRKVSIEKGIVEEDAFEDLLAKARLYSPDNELART